METVNGELKVPILKKDAIINIELNYSQMGALVQSLFIFASHWDDAKRKQFQEVLEKKGKLDDPEFITYILLDQIYRNTILKAQQEDKIEMTDVSMSALSTPTN